MTRKELTADIKNRVAAGESKRAIFSRYSMTEWEDAASRIVTRIRLLAIDPFPSWSRIGQINCPLYVVHGTSDEVVPYSQGRTLYDLAKDPKEFLPIPNAGHTDFFEVYGVERYTEKMLVFLRHQENNPKIGEP